MLDQSCCVALSAQQSVISAHGYYRDLDREFVFSTPCIIFRMSLHHNVQTHSTHTLISIGSRSQPYRLYTPQSLVRIIKMDSTAFNACRDGHQTQASATPTLSIHTTAPPWIGAISTLFMAAYGFPIAILFWWDFLINRPSIHLRRFFAHRALRVANRISPLPEQARHSCNAEVIFATDGTACSLSTDSSNSSCQVIHTLCCHASCPETSPCAAHHRHARSAHFEAEKIFERSSTTPIGDARPGFASRLACCRETAFVRQDQARFWAKITQLELEIERLKAAPRPKDPCARCQRCFCRKREDLYEDDDERVRLPRPYDSAKRRAWSNRI